MYRRDPHHRLPWVIRQLRTKHAPGKKHYGAGLRSAHGWLESCGLGSACHAIQRFYTPCPLSIPQLYSIVGCALRASRSSSLSPTSTTISTKIMERNIPGARLFSLCTRYGVPAPRVPVGRTRHRPQARYISPQYTGSYSSTVRETYSTVIRK